MHKPSYLRRQRVVLLQAPGIIDLTILPNFISLTFGVVYSWKVFHGLFYITGAICRTILTFFSFFYSQIHLARRYRLFAITLCLEWELPFPVSEYHFRRPHWPSQHALQSWPTPPAQPDRSALWLSSTATSSPSGARFSSLWCTLDDDSAYFVSFPSKY